MALLKEPQVRAPNRAGRSTVTVGTTSFGVDAGELRGVEACTEMIRQAVSTAGNQAG